MYKNVASQKAVVYAYDKTTGLPQTGDAGNITGYIAKDGVASAATDDTNPTEIDDTNMPGYYAFDLTQAETNCDHFVLYAVSGTADTLVSNVETFTFPGDGTALAADVIEVSGDSDAADNLESACDNYSVTRGLAGTALPAAAADAAGGLPISDAGGLDLDTKLANTNEVTTARMGALTDWIDGGRLDLLLDAIKDVTDAIPDSGALTTLTGYVDELETRLTADRAGYLDNLNIGEDVAGTSEIPSASDIWSNTVHGSGGNEVTALEALAEVHSYSALEADRNETTGAITYKDPDDANAFTLTPDTDGRTRS